MFANFFLVLSFNFSLFVKKMCGIVFIHLKKKIAHFLVTRKYNMLDQPDGLSSLRLMQSFTTVRFSLERRKGSGWMKDVRQIMSFS